VNDTFLILLAANGWFFVLLGEGVLGDCKALLKDCQLWGRTAGPWFLSSE